MLCHFRLPVVLLTILSQMAAQAQLSKEQMILLNRGLRIQGLTTPDNFGY